VKFSVRVPSDEIRADLRAAKRAYGTQQRPALEAMGVSLLSNSQQAYLQKSKGLRGSDGITWGALAQSTIDRRNRRGRKNATRATTKSGKARPTGGSVDIGRDTGLQLNSGRPGFSAKGGGNIFRLTSTSVTVGYGMSYSKYFDEERALMPDVVPDPWVKQLEAIAGRWAEAIMKGRLGT
jgi:hypothetical protein